MSVRTKLLGVVGGIALMAMTGAANAHSIILTLVGGPTPDGAEFDYTYEADLTAINEVLPGDNFTLYDFAGYDAAMGVTNVTGLLAVNWGIAVEAMHMPPGGTAPTNTNLPDITFTYTGVVPIVAPVELPLGTFTLTSTIGDHAVPSINSPNYTGQDHDPATGLMQANIGETDAPVLPAPASVWGGLGLLGLLVARRVTRQVA